jgi:hypothetical protein
MSGIIGGPAQSVVTSTEAPDGGPARPVAVVSVPLYTLAGPPLKIVEVSDNRARIGGPAMPVVVASGAAAGSPTAGPPIPVYVVSGSLSTNPTLGSPSMALMNTTFTNDLSADGMTWDAVNGAFRIETAHGDYVQYIQRYNGGTKLCYFIISTDKGATWHDNAGVVGGEGFLTRGDIIYDAGRDCFHGLIVTENPGDGGIIYRRYSITRVGGAITSIARVGGVSLSMDDASSGNDFPTLIMTDANTLLAAWTARTGSGGEIRCCKCDISGDADAGGTAANWVNIGVNSATTIGSPPAVASYTIPFTQATSAFTYFALLQMTSGDLGWFYHNGAAPGIFRWRRSVRNAANSWNSFATAVTISNVQVAGADTGYSLKNQLIAELVQIGAIVYAVAPVWLSNAAGDTVRLFRIAADDTATAATVYSAGGAHSYAPTCGLACDATSARLIVSYLKTTTSFPALQTFDAALAQQQADTPIETTVICDIPLIVFARDNGKLGVAFRKQGSPPQPGYFATLTWN